MVVEGGGLFSERRPVCRMSLPSWLSKTLPIYVALDVKKQILYSLNIRDLDGSAAEAKYSEVVKNETEQDGQKLYECRLMARTS